MKKKLLAGLLAVAMVATMFAGCGKKVDDKVIHVMSFTDEIPNMIQKYLDMHPELGYTVDPTIVATTDQQYQPALDEMLKSKKDAPDIYGLEAAFVLKYTQGDAAGFAATYDDLGIDTTKRLADAKIATYASEVGTRPADGKVVALPYQATGGCFLYRRSIAKDVWGTDDPAVISEKIGGGSGNWDQFWVAAEELKAKGYGIISGDGDIWHAIENSSDSAWIVDGKLNIDPKREALLDISKKLKDNDYHNETQDWQDGWFADMKGEGPKQVLGFFGPAWLINYSLAENCGDDLTTEEREGTYGDWAITTSPVGFCWGGTYVASSKTAVKNMSDAKKQVVADIIEWITLDTDENSLQYMWANGTFNPEKATKDAVASAVVMEKSNGEVEILGGQDMFEYFVPAGDYATGANMTQYDEAINGCWRDAVRAYVAGKVDRAGAIEMFRADVKSKVGIE
ncbi:MAG: carbohydrate ABC transporter substrate-binding protein [Lachnospiraceae bacterium]|nr:carbohydrate ABC transporter substrate-binding protein [Lachnospiraceae bacterium]